MLLFVVVVGLVDVVRCNWENWWTYDGISGPAYWGLINPAWTMCNKVGPGPNTHFMRFVQLIKISC